jgi:GTP cyclohydrolase II
MHVKLWSACRQAVSERLRQFRLCVYHDKTVDELHYALVKGEPHPTGQCSCASTSPSSSSTLRLRRHSHAYSVQDALRIVAHHKEGVCLLRRTSRRRDRGDPRADRGRPRERRSARNWDPHCTASARRSLRDLGVGKMPSSPRPKRIRACRIRVEIEEYVSPDDALVRAV